MVTTSEDGDGDGMLFVLVFGNKQSGRVVLFVVYTVVRLAAQGCRFPYWHSSLSLLRAPSIVKIDTRDIVFGHHRYLLDMYPIQQ